MLFWTFLLMSSIVMFPIAVLIWALTSPFEGARRSARGPPT